jgi:DNA-binding response OmpR family regulator
MSERPHLLIVEDERLYAQALTLFLEDCGFRSTAAGNGLQALIELQKQHFDLILLDVNMPGLDGYDICAGIKSDPRYASIPVIFLTSEDDPKSTLTGFEVGAADYVSKGARRDILLARIKAHLPPSND